MPWTRLPAIHSDKPSRRHGIPDALRKSKVLKFIPKLDALLGLLGATADALAATRDLLKDETGPGAKPRIH